MNGFASIGLGQALSRGFRPRTNMPRAMAARDMGPFIQSNHRAWRDVVGDHSADASADHTIARLRAMTGATSALARRSRAAATNAAFGG